ncbi:MAG: sulfatase-like hydrolase/transferase [Bacteroides sp.]|nr:sulfatase-like hydrolase/transferase [Bacteroides sp.]MCM1413504.1 sulfatase-like hydrolase/transferase [Bacteroides sp.]MCM1471058.1 sulfatase-like hydrolase/transferase [Bacteroides sp.]
MFDFLLIPSVYFLACIAWFAIVQKPIFGIYNRITSADPIGLSTVAGVYRHGIGTDAIIAAYLSAIPLLVGALATMIPAINAPTVLTVYNVILALALGLLVTSDFLLYRFWKFKIDSSVFIYLRSIKGATASVSTLYLIGGLLTWLAVSATFFIFAQTACLLAVHFAPVPSSLEAWWTYPIVIAVTLLFAGLLFIVIRGLGIRPNSPSIAYYSSNQFLNHWALNPAYSMIYSLSKKDDFATAFRSMDDEECREITDRLFPATGAPAIKLLNTVRPNILLVIWESFGAEFSRAFGGRDGIAVNVDRLAKEGAAFTNCTAGSFRTDRGLVNVISGYPAQPTTSIIRHTRKLPNLPALARTMQSMGYTTEAIHGGDLSIMNKNDYYLASGHQRLVGQSDMPSGLAAGKWGIHDGPMMDFAADEAIRLSAEGKPFMITLQTLSSHEPFEVPYSRLTDKIDNSFAYTDSSLGAMVDRLRNSPAWSNLLIVVVADHSLNRPVPTTDRFSHSHIPLLMLGGAVDRPVVIDKMMSQTDIPAIILGQMGIDHSDFPFSRDILSDDYADPSALHVFMNGAMLADADGYTVYDTLLQRVIEGDNDPDRLNKIKAALQRIYQDLYQR